MKTYTEKEVELVVKYAMSYQKKADYQKIDDFLSLESEYTYESGVKTLDYLANDKIAFDELDYKNALETINLSLPLPRS